jgi:hypothetical protein
LNSAIVALVSNAALIKHKKAVVAEQARIRAEEAERRRRDEAKKLRIKQRQDYLIKKADSYVGFRSLAAFAEMIATKVTEDGNQPLDRLARDLKELISQSERQFERDELNAEISRLGLFADDDLGDYTHEDGAGGGHSTN